MANKTMKTLTMGNKKYEIVDAKARTEINSLKNGIKIKKEINETLLASGWSGTEPPYSYSITIEGHLNSTDIVELTVGDEMTLDQVLVLQSANIVRAEWLNNTTLVLYAYGAKPDIDAPVKIYVNTPFS